MEDNAGDARLLREFLPVGFRVVHVVRLKDALAELERGEHDVVLLDLSLPDSHGLETCRTVRTSSPHLPVIVLTGLADEQTAVQAMREGAQDWLVKGRTDGDLVARAVRYAIERNRLHTRLQELDRVRSLFLSVVSHDLRSPAASILAGVDLLLSERLGPLTAEQRHVLDLARKSAQRQTRLIRDLLDVAVIEAGAMKIVSAPHPIRGLVAGLVDELTLATGQGPNGLSVDNAVPSELVVHADADRLGQAIGNLLSNAARFARTTVKVSAEPSGADEVAIAVEDDGPGVAAEVRDQLFDRFARSSGPRGGAGLGLWIVRRIAEAHRGSIRLEPSPRGGARFVLTVPRGSEKSPEPTSGLV